MKFRVRVSFKSLKKYFDLFVCTRCVTEIRREPRVDFLHHVGPRDKSDDQAWQQMTLPTEPSDWLIVYLLPVIMNGIYRETWNLKFFFF